MELDKFYLFLICISIISLFIIGNNLFKSDIIEIDPWWNSTFTKRENITISGMNVPTRVNYAVAINVSYDSDMNTAFNDLRFTNDTTPIGYWIETNVTSKWAYVWINVPYLPPSPNATILMYYGSGDVTSTQNGKATFPFFDNFEDGSYNTTIWTTHTGTPVEANGVLKLGNGDYVRVRSNIGFMTNYSVIWRNNFSISTKDYCGWIGTNPLDSDYLADFSFSANLLESKSSIATQIAYNGGWLADSVFGRYEVIRNGTKSNAFFQNYTYVGENWANIPTNNMSLWFANSGADQNGLHLDWVLIRNYSYPEATVTVLSEETYVSTTSTIPMSLSVQMPSWIGYSSEDTTTDSNYSSVLWVNNWTMISGGVKNTVVLANTSKSTWTGIINSYRPVSYVLGGGVNTNPTYAYDDGINDTSTYAQTGGDGAATGAITYTFNLSQNLSTTLFYSFNGTSGGVQLYNFSSANWDTIGTSAATLNMTFIYLFPNYIDSTGNVSLRIVSAGVSTGAYTRLWDTYTIYQTVGSTNPPRYWWGKFNISNLTYFDTATLNLYKQPILDNTWGENCNITKPCIATSYYSLNQTWSKITWNTQPAWINYIIQRKNITTDIGSESFNITGNLKSIYPNSTFVLRVPMQDLWLKSVNFTKSNYSYPVTAYFRPYIYSSSGNVTNTTYAFDNNYNDTSTYMESGSNEESGGSDGIIEYWFEVGTNKFNGTLFFTYNYDADGPTQQPLIQVCNSTATDMITCSNWYNFYGSYYDESGYCYPVVGPGVYICSLPLLDSTRFRNSTGPLVNSRGFVKMRFSNNGRLYDTYIVINDVSSGPYINASVTKYLLNESSCISLGNVNCYQNGTFTPRGQTNSQWIFNVTNVGTVNGSIYASWSQNLPSCMNHYLSINSTLEPSVDYSVRTTSNVYIGSLNTSQSLQYWGFFVLNNCTAGYWINSTLIFT